MRWTLALRPDWLLANHRAPVVVVLGRIRSTLGASTNIQLRCCGSALFGVVLLAHRRADVSPH